MIPGGSAFGSRSRSSDPAFKCRSVGGNRQFRIDVDALQLDPFRIAAAPIRNTGI